GPGGAATEVARWSPQVTTHNARPPGSMGGENRVPVDTAAHAVRCGLDGLARVGRRSTARSAPRGEWLVDLLDPKHPAARDPLPCLRPRHARIRRRTRPTCSPVWW